jgi:thioredoxin reductase (NADPH)
MTATAEESAAFPVLPPELIEEMVTCAAPMRRTFKKGESLYQAGDRDFGFFVIVAGKVEIRDGGDESKVITTYGPGQFTGDIALLTGGPSLATAVAIEDIEAYEVPHETLRQVVAECPGTGDVLLQAFIARRQMLRDAGYTGMRVIGSRYDRETFRVRDFLSKNRIPLTWLDLESDAQVRGFLEGVGFTAADTPVVVIGKTLLRNPSNRELAEAIGIHRPLEHVVYDLAIAGGGPSGLAAAVYGASEGLNTVVLERIAPGGQAGLSMRIENYLGFPMGVTGLELAEKAVLQASKFGAHLSVPTPVVSLSFDNSYPVLTLEDGETITAKCLLIATGAQYRRLTAEGCEPFEGRGVYYAATKIEAQLCKGTEVVIVGGGNSAGQAAIFLAPTVKKIYLVVRGDSLEKYMSTYLIRRIEQTDNIEVLTNTVVENMGGEGCLTAVTLVNRRTGERRTIDTPALFSFIGAEPRSNWLPDEIEKDERGFVRSGLAVTKKLDHGLTRDRFLLETSYPGVFAAGDVRAGSVKRVASAVGEGAMAVQFVHEFLKDR